MTIFSIWFEGSRSSPQLKTHLDKRLVELKNSQHRLNNRILNSEKLSEEIEKFYYTSWYWSAIHVAVSIPTYRTVKSLAERLNLPSNLILQCLQVLNRLGLVRLENDQWIFRGGATHLAPESVMTELNHTHWRQRAVLDVQKQNETGLHYTSIFSMSLKDVNQLREHLVKAITQSRKISDPSAPEELFNLNLDFFQI